MTVKFDIDAIRRNCDEFFSLYKTTTHRTREMCRCKLEHTHRVAQNCRDIAKSIGLDEYDCDIAWIIGELHDFARFGQAVATKTFVDSERFNHARLGARILFTHGMIEDIIPEYHRIPEEDRAVMYKAVYYHSDYELPADLTERERLFCVIIRDADKADIFRAIYESSFEATCDGFSRDEVLGSDISPAVEAAFFAHKTVKNSDRIFPADFHAAHIALCFGLETDAAKAITAGQGYLSGIMNVEFSRPDVHKRYEAMKEEVRKFLGI